MVDTPTESSAKPAQYVWVKPATPFGSRQETEKGLILAGGAAGVAAAFNTPLAGIVFAIEEMSRSFEERTSGTMITAVIIAGVASLAVLGNSPYFGRTSATLPPESAPAQGS